MINIVIIGSGAIAAEVCSYINDINVLALKKIRVIGFIDDNFENFKKNSIKYKFDQPYLGTTDSYEFNEESKFIFGFSNIKSRLNFLRKDIANKISFITIIHPTALIADTAVIGEGNIINPNCVIGPNAIIGNNNILTSYSFISHDCNVGNNNFFSTSGLSGNVSVGDNNFFGIRVTVIPEVTIGSNNLIQAGMTIDKNVTDDETVFYRYKEKISIINKDLQ
jgi:sugar O-acyltransferase (sialic acid O-acetyltransferase NeuD family)